MDRLTRLIGALLVLFTCAGASTVSATPRGLSQDKSPDAAAIEAYRANDLETARSLWLELLEQDPPAVVGRERARIAYNLGNLASRDGDELQAVGWYSAALRERPRDDDTWANLKLARLNAGLEAADRGDLRATVQHLILSLTLTESSWLALFGLLPLALCLGFEAFRGGRRWRWASAAAFCHALLLVVPYWARSQEARSDPMLVTKTEGLALRSEPRPDANRILELEVGDEVERIDEILEWTSVRALGGRRGWVKTEGVFALRR